MSFQELEESPPFFAHQAGAKAGENFGVDLQQPTRRATHGRKSDDLGGVPAEVFFPSVAARMEQSGQFAGIGIEAGKVRTFVEVTENAGPGQIFVAVRPAMFPGDDVFDMEIFGFKRRIRQPAVFATTARALSDPLSLSGSHCWPEALRNRRALDWSKAKSPRNWA